jgi:hypothetical protein
MAMGAVAFIPRADAAAVSALPHAKGSPARMLVGRHSARPAEGTGSRYCIHPTIQRRYLRRDSLRRS